MKRYHLDMTENEKLMTHKIGDFIRKLRGAAGWSQEDLAGEAGVHTNYIGTIERAEQTPSVEVLGKIVHALGKSMSEFFAEIGD